jgi:hypothetical protein
MTNLLILGGQAFPAGGMLGKIAAAGAAILMSGILLQAPVKAQPPLRVADFVGDWKNDNPQTRGVTTLEVRQRGDALAVHAWGACSPKDCDWGVSTGLAEHRSANIEWDQGFVLRKMSLFIEEGRLRMVLDSVYRDKRPPQHEVESFGRR